ncbi:MAG: patatin-like phospholipase family protein [Proteobacteria bacterium]|nr:patatin-like phospholipase family protein [Pseudomonadota bacterium]
MSEEQPRPDVESMTHAMEFVAVHAEERRRLKLAPDLKALDGTGLAFSGGGIRSASFALGVLQVLLNQELLKRIDYLATVSGGGYLGAAVSWWLHLAATDPGALAAPPPAGAESVPLTDGRRRYEVFREQFGSKVKGARTLGGISHRSAWGALNWLSYIRQHGNYLQPPGVGWASLVATALRVCLYSLSVYGGVLIGVFALLRTAREHWDQWTRESAFLHTLTSWTDRLGTLLQMADDPLIRLGLTLATAAGVVLIGISAFYGPATWLASESWLLSPRGLYAARTRFRKYSGCILTIALVGLLVASVPFLYDVIECHGRAWVAALSSLSLGTLGTLFQFVQGRAQDKTSGWLAPARIIVTAGLVLYGLLLGAYSASRLWPLDPTWLAAGTLGLAGIFGLLVNTNYAGLSRLYRDRLMEAFLPSLDTVATNDWRPATQADTQAVRDLKGHVTREGELHAVTETNCPRPLHLINCNTVLIDSPKDLYRNRGGDNFAISPLWSGSNATGWIRTGRLGDGAVSLPTAMAISGAAANPNTAPNGTGITRNRLVSFLMSLFNVRLGYWMANPRQVDPDKPSNKPNLWFPGFRQGLLGRGLSEEAAFLELTDGGHYDNTGIYELVRRRTRLIILAQAGCDAQFSMEDLAMVIEKVRVDFSVFIEFRDTLYPLEALRPTRIPGGRAVRGFAVGRVRYPKGAAASQEYEDGYIVYLQAVPIQAMPPDVASYWRRHPDFPNDTTADQFFTEANLEAYRELGYAVASQFYRAVTGVGDAQSLLGQIRAVLKV